VSVSVLVSGVVLGQPMGGVRRHNAELLPRVARLLADLGGTLAMLEGAEPVAFELPASVERIATTVPARPALVRSVQEGRALRHTVQDAAARGRPFDLIHTAHLPVPRRLPLPYTITIHDLRSLELAHTPFSRRLVARTVIGDAVRNARCVFTVSETVRAALRERWDLAPERVVVVPNAADHFEPAPRAPAPDAPLLHVGHLELRKNLELVVRALAEDRDLPRLVLAGAAKHGEDERLLALAGELGVTERLTIIGPFDDADLPRLYAEAACIVLPSRLEGFGIPVLEAQRARVPLAIARAGALVEIAGEHTPSFDPDDAAACARAIRAALATSEAELDASAVRASRFNWGRSASVWADTWARL